MHIAAPTYSGAGRISALLLRSEGCELRPGVPGVGSFQPFVRLVRASARLAQAVSSGLERTSAHSAKLHVTLITNRIPHEQRRWPREGSNLRTRIRSPRAESPICRGKLVDGKAARQCARHSRVGRLNDALTAPRRPRDIHGFEGRRVGFYAAAWSTSAAPALLMPCCGGVADRNAGLR
jgi:hypothetical protein